MRSALFQDVTNSEKKVAEDPLMTHDIHDNQEETNRPRAFPDRKRTQWEYG